MTQTQEHTPVQAAIVRSEEIVDRIGHNIGTFAALTRQRIQQTATRLEAGPAPTQMEPTVQPETVQGKQPNQLESEPMQTETQRAERLVDDIGQRLALLTSAVGLQIRKMAAYAREGTEDIWAEAQYIRSARRGQ